MPILGSVRGSVLGAARSLLTRAPSRLPFGQAASRGAIESRSLAELVRAGVVSPESPHKLVELARSLLGKPQVAALLTAAVIRHGDAPALTDELGTLTWTQLGKRSDALACALLDRGIGGTDCIGILCRNHRGFLDITFAASKLGARALYLNTDFAGPQLRDVCLREGVSVLVLDEEFEKLAGEVEVPGGHIIAWNEDAVGATTLEQLIASNPGRTPPPATGNNSIVLLTSGTTGTPKGAPRHSGMTLHPIGAILSKVPYRACESTYVVAPMFHGLGFTQAIMAVALGSRIITHRRFAPERVLDTITSERPTGLVVVPVMLQRIVASLEAEPDRWNVDSLRVVFLSGSQLEAELVRRTHRTIGEKLYNFYGTTEVAWATFATPEDLREAPGCAGRPPFGTTVRLYDADGGPVNGAGATGRVFVGNGSQFDGYTGGGGKEIIDGLMSTGDIGHFDEAGRLFIDGRDDDMVICGGENVFPGEVEELLITHASVEEAAVIGVDDAEFGKRLAAYVVLRPGQTLSEEQVQELVRANLARYKAPRDVFFVDKLPRTPTGKVLKRSLGETHARGDS